MGRTNIGTLFVLVLRIVSCDEYFVCVLAAAKHSPGHAESPHIAVHRFQCLHVFITQNKVKQLKIQQSVYMLKIIIKTEFIHINPILLQLQESVPEPIDLQWQKLN